MRCPNCGTDNPAGAKFCGACGASLADAAKAQETAVATKPVEVTPTPAVTASNSHVTISKNTLILGVVLILAAIGGIIAYTTVSHTVDIEDYFLPEEEVIYVGANGYGERNSDHEDFIDAEALYCDIYGVEPAELEYEIENDLANAYFAFQECLLENTIIDIDQYNTYLSNGDTYTVIVTPDFDAINAFTRSKKKLTGPVRAQKTYTVSGLVETEEVDPFTGIYDVAMYYSNGILRDVVFYHTNGFSAGDCTIVPEDAFNWIIKDSQGLEVGSYSVDVALPGTGEGSDCTLSIDVSEDLYSEYGIIFSSTEKKMPGDMLSYATNSQVLQKEDWEKFHSLLKDDIAIGDEPVALYFDVATSTSESHQNSLEVVVKKTYGQTTYYQSYYVNDILQNAEGKVVWISSDHYYVYSGRRFNSEAEYKEYYSNHEGDTVKAYDVSALLSE